MANVGKGARLRAQILRYLSRQEKLTNELPELEGIAKVLGIATEDVSDQIDILDSMGAVKANRTLGGGAAPMITGAGKALLEELEEEMEVEDRPRLGGNSAGAGYQWDAFISHASDDKEPFVQRLAQELIREGVNVWYDDFALAVGDSLRRSIDKGLARSRYGIVVLSPRFFLKEWPQKELDGLAVRESAGQKVILPVWLDLDRDEVAKYSPMLADRIAAKATNGLANVVGSLKRAILEGPSIELEADPSVPMRSPRPDGVSLAIEFDAANARMLGPIQFPDGTRRKFACVRVANTGGSTARRSWGILKLISWPGSFRPLVTQFALHWADTDYTMESDVAEPVDIQTWRHLDVAFALPGGTKDIGERAITSSPIYSISSTPVTESMGPGTSPTRFRSGPVPFQPAMPAKAGENRHPAGCWVAIPLALSQPSLASQAHLPPGLYEIEVRVGCENGLGDSKRFKLRSPQSWLDLRLEASA